MDGFSVFPKLRGSVIEVVPIRFPLPRLFIRGDVDSNRVVDITDAITLLNFLFLGGPPPSVPFPSLGLDPTPDDLEDC